MSGDDFADLCRRDGVLHVAARILQRGGSPSGAAAARLSRACGELFLQCAERARLHGIEAPALAWSGAAAVEAELRRARAPAPEAVEAMERERLRRAVARPRADRHKRPIYYGEDHASRLAARAPPEAGRPPPARVGEGGPAYDEDGVRVVMDSGATGDVRAARAAWVNKPLREKLRWTQVRGDRFVPARTPDGGIPAPVVPGR